jgi:SPOR domain
MVNNKLYFVLIILGFSSGLVCAQDFVKTSSLFLRTNENSSAGRLNIIQDPSLDTLISRYISGKKKLYENAGYYGMEGFRIQIYNSSTRNAREESGKVRAEFMSKFPGIVSYQLYADPGWFKIRVGDFRTKSEAIKLLLSVSKEFDAYIVPDFINLPDLNLK